MEFGRYAQTIIVLAEFHVGRFAIAQYIDFPFTFAQSTPAYVPNVAHGFVITFPCPLKSFVVFIESSGKYATVFGVTLLHILIDVQSNSVTTDFGWHPGINTIAYYPLTSTSQATDKSSNHLNGTISGNITFGTNLGVDCASFNGGSNYITVPYDAIMNTNTFTLSIWLTKSNASDWNKGAISRGTFNNQGGNFALCNYFNTNGGSFLINNTHSSSFTMFDGINKWVNVILTYDGSVGEVYVNSNKVLTYNKTFDMSSLTTKLIIGGYYNSNYCWQGNMSNIIWENKKWTLQEIQTYFNKMKLKYGL